MLPEDLSKVVEIEALCYTEVAPESEESLGSKRAVSPAACFVACQDAEVIGYLIALPVRFESPPGMHETTREPAAPPDAFYLHDLAVSPAARGAGVGAALVEIFLNHAEGVKLGRASLIAVQHSAPYWRRHGFRPAATPPPVKAQLAGYGPEACYMERWL